MVDSTLEQVGFPVNDTGSIVASHSLDNRTVVGCLAPGYVPVNEQGQVMLNIPAQTPTYELGVLYFDTLADASPTDAGACYWSDEDKTVIINSGVNGVKNAVGQELYAPIGIATETITAGQVCRVSGSSGGYPTYSLADCDTYDYAHNTIGVATSSATVGQLIFVTRFGNVHDLDTSAFAADDVLYLGTSPGQLTNVRPLSKDTLVRVGWVVVSDDTVGTILVDPMHEVNNEGSLIDLQLRTASTAVPTTPTAFIWPTVVADALGTYNNSTGVFTTAFAGMFSLSMMINAVTTGGTNQIYFAPQRWNGSAWEIIDYTTRQSAVRLADKHQIIFVSQNYFPAGTQLRFMIWAAAAGMDVVTETIAVGYDVVASRLLISGIKTV